MPLPDVITYQIKSQVPGIGYLSFLYDDWRSTESTNTVRQLLMSFGYLMEVDTKNLLLNKTHI